MHKLSDMIKLSLMKLISITWEFEKRKGKRV